jgi:hypothetical protein
MTIMALKTMPGNLSHQESAIKEIQIPHIYFIISFIPPAYPAQ